MIGKMHIVEESANRIKLESDTHFAVVSKEYKGKPRDKWLLTAYEKKNNALDNTMDTAKTQKGNGNDTATPENIVSTNEDTNKTLKAKELEEIISKSKENGTYLKAPNGKDFKLNPEQWVTVRTKRFKDWFGDWETSAKRVNIVKSTISHGFKNFEEAREWAKKNIVKSYSNNETNGKGNINISNTSIDKFLSESSIVKSDNKDVHLSVLRILPDVIRESIDAEQHPDYLKDNSGKRSPKNGINKNVTIHRLYGAVDIDEKNYRVKITVKENVNDPNSPHKAYNYETTKIELLAGQHEEAAVNTEPSSRNSNNSITIAILLKGVEKSYNKGKKLLDSSKIVDENGEPLVVYHNSPYNFNIFDISKFGSSTDHGVFGVGFYFGQKEHSAYGGNRYEVFLNIKNPYVINQKDLYDLRFGDRKGESGFTRYGDLLDNKFLEENGYDGVVYNDNYLASSEIVALKPNQIKSSIDNTEFSNENNDIRFRMLDGESSETNNKELEKINSEFNGNIKKQKSGELSDNFVYNLGYPGIFLKSSGIPNLAIELPSSVLKIKSTSGKHDYDLLEITDLPKEINRPLATFKYGDSKKAQNILTVLDHNGEKFLVGIFIKPTVKGKVLEVNNIRNVFPKNTDSIIKWIIDGKLTNVDKEKLLSFLDQQRTNHADVAFVLPDKRVKQENLEAAMNSTSTDAPIEITNFLKGVEKSYKKMKNSRCRERTQKQP